MNYESFFVILFYILLLNFFFYKSNLIRDESKILPHKKFIGYNIEPPFSGGIFLLITIFIYFQSSLTFKILLFLIFLTGFLSDKNFLKSPNLRFYIQLILVILIIVSSDQYIDSIRINLFDHFLDNFIFKLFFTAFCLLILINGTNFLDGVNTLVIGYYLLICLFLSRIHFGINSSIDIEFLYLLIFSLAILFLLNCFGLLMLGDNGSYIISVFIGLYLIEIANSNLIISPYFIMNLLWYPAYENLFSIIRKLYTNKSALSPDNLHLHQLIFMNIKKKIYKNNYANSLTGILINIYNLFIFYLASSNYANTKYQLALVFLSVLIYNILYIFLKLNLSKSK